LLTAAPSTASSEATRPASSRQRSQHCHGIEPRRRSTRRIVATRKRRLRNLTHAVPVTKFVMRTTTVAGSDGQNSPVKVRAFRFGTRSTRTVTSDTADEHSELLKQLARHLIDIHQRVARIASDEFSAAERETLRRLASHDGVPRVFELSNYLYCCSGERIRSLRKAPAPMRKACADGDSFFNE
jgi:hypothetical protein